MMDANSSAYHMCLQAILRHYYPEGRALFKTFERRDITLISVIWTSRSSSTSRPGGGETQGTDIHDIFKWIVKEKRDVNCMLPQPMEPIRAHGRVFPNSPQARPEEARKLVPSADHATIV